MRPNSQPQKLLFVQTAPEKAKNTVVSKCSPAPFSATAGQKSQKIFFAASFDVILLNFRPPGNSTSYATSCLNSSLFDPQASQ